VPLYVTAFLSAADVGLHLDVDFADGATPDLAAVLAEFGTDRYRALVAFHDPAGPMSLLISPWCAGCRTAPTEVLAADPAEANFLVPACASCVVDRKWSPSTLLEVTAATGWEVRLFEQAEFTSDNPPAYHQPAGKSVTGTPRSNVPRPESSSTVAGAPLRPVFSDR
jgi:hypothetical protein